MLVISASLAFSKKKGRYSTKIASYIDATALTFGSSEFLTFDQNQARLASMEVSEFNLSANQDP
jgi:hypothetical protein